MVATIGRVLIYGMLSQVLSSPCGTIQRIKPRTCGIMWPSSLETAIFVVSVLAQEVAKSSSILCDNFIHHLEATLG